MFTVKAEEKKYRLKEMARKLGERGENYMKGVKGEQLKELRSQHQMPQIVPKGRAALWSDA